MKVLFAVNDENISTEIVKKYQKEYKEIISYKNVYFYNAILKELQRDKSYDRIVISEELEEFTSTSYEQKDKFIFEKLDEISDEALKSDQSNIEIILISSERRSKSDEILVKLFGIGIYNAIIGNDRSIDEVCKLINTPRSKKQAKIYYGIESEEINYRPESEDDVNEDEMRNILNHFKRLGKNEDQYVQSFNNIVSQYNEKQLKIIISMLPLNVKAVLEEKSPQYQKIATSGGMISKISSRQKMMQKNGPSEKLLVGEKTIKNSRPVVVPTTMGSSNVKKLITKKQKPVEVSYEEEEVEDEENIKEAQIIEEKPKKRGRPRKEVKISQADLPEEKSRKRGRPKKKKEEDILPEFEEEDIEKQSMLPGFEEENEGEDNILPGFDDLPESGDRIESDNLLPGFDGEDVQSKEIEDDNFLPSVDQQEDFSKTQMPNNYNSSYENRELRNNRNYYEENSYSSNFDKNEFQSLLTSDKKIVAFLGTSKNGTSFIVNSIAEVLSKAGVNVAILDATQNKNAYYIYTKNEENLRRAAQNSFQNLIYGNAYGVEANSNLTVYTGIPSENENIKNFGPILETLVKNHSCILIDCDFNTPKEYFDNIQEIYLVQSMDILTIQPLTAFLRELKAKNILDEQKIRIVINKFVRLKGVTSKNIIGGMAFYNDPEMSFMTELFDRNNVKYTEVPFDEEVYAKYLSGIAECEISSNSYPKEFKSVLKNLSEKVYQFAPRQVASSKKKNKANQAPSYANSFSSSMNNTLNNMKKKY